MAAILDKRSSLHRRVGDLEEVNHRLAIEMAKMETLANVGMVSAMIAHEINNILTPLGSYAQLAAKHPDDKELADKVIRKTILHSERAGNILKSMLAMSGGDGQEKKKHHLKALVDEVFVCMARDMAKDSIKVIVEVAENLTVWANGICIQQVLMNLILNARQAMMGEVDKAGVLKISAEKEADCVIIEVADNGCGIEEKNVGRIFEAFFTTRGGKDGSRSTGAGLGLAFCKKIIDAHGGTIAVKSGGSDGTTFRVVLPLETEMHENNE